MLRIAIQSKGRLNEDSVALLKEIGINIDESKRKFLVQAGNFPLELLLVRDDDIPQIVSNGTAELGIVGLNEVKESGKDVKIVDKLGFGACRISLAIPKTEEYTGPSYFEGKRIATSYPNILRRFLADNNVKTDIHVIQGSVEIAPGIGLADGIFDIVSSGSTLVSNNLKEVEVVMQSEALLIGNKNLSDDKKAILDDLLFRVESVLIADDKKYVRMNAPKANLDEIVKVLPGLKSPTIIPLADPEWCSVHAVLDEKHFWEIVGQLKALGAEGILVTPIEKMIL